MYSCTSRLRSPPAPKPFPGVGDDPEAHGAVDVLDRRPGSSPQEPVAQGILQAGELGSEGLEAIDPFRRGELFREPFAVDGSGAAEEPLRDCHDVTSLRSTKSRTRASGGEAVHRATPDRLAVS
jgi:hypothetical protein